ncbi:hypothetical protein GCM10010503_58360 [Streptomyces lucensis JCM 4490]|uniref:Uncharacterized protein n=1 Tax=Streptomyces lucensis JCM 4490 TaxID=1306176 RepID=A0A918MVC0_9ACTN|nr:hypothetical protein [Streptomyces lucensis]GGW73195.1 hypothetical protein GCM10010503_58360 [Streptomyces lucensis JCM 4490]
MTDRTTPRPLSALEQRVLRKLLSPEFPGARELREQVAAARVTGHWGAESPSVDLDVSGPAPRAPIADGVLPATGTVTDASGGLSGELLVWVGDGRLSALELTWYGDTAPTELPDPEDVGVTVQ